MKVVECLNCEGCSEYFVRSSGEEGCSARNRALLNPKQSLSLQNPVRFTGNKDSCLDYTPNFILAVSDETKGQTLSLRGLVTRARFFIYSLSSALPPV